MKFLRFRLMITILVLLTLLSVIPAFAAKPDIQNFSAEYSYQIQCDGFHLDAQGTEKFRLTTFFDQEGAPIKLQGHFEFDELITSSLTGQTLSSPAHFMFQVDLQENTQSWTGFLYRIVVPGRGIAVLDAGRLIADFNGDLIFEGGPHMVFHGGEEVICTAFE
jgi:hypothetical protein